MENLDITRVRKALSDRAPMLFNSGPVVFAYLYGSYARGDVHPFSDVDIGIYLEKMTPGEALNNELSLALEFDDILGSKTNVDVRSINTMPLMIKGNIVTEGILLYSRDDAVRVEFETNVRKKYFDFRRFINRYQKAYLSYSIAGNQ
jgi:predicted nucleotidyltransferase